MEVETSKGPTSRTPSTTSLSPHPVSSADISSDSGSGREKKDRGSSPRERKEKEKKDKEKDKKHQRRSAAAAFGGFSSSSNPSCRATGTFDRCLRPSARRFSEHKAFTCNGPPMPATPNVAPLNALPPSNKPMENRKDLEVVEAIKRTPTSGLWGENGPSEIADEELTYLEKIGGGCFGMVYRGLCRGKEVAIKKLNKQNVDPKVLEDFKKEVRIMSRLQHPNVLLLMGACTTEGKMAIVTEYMPRGNLNSLIHESKCDLSLFRRLRLIRDTAQGMNWLHRSNPIIIHRDLKPMNLLLDQHLSVKVCDFGLSNVKVRGEFVCDPKGKAPGSPLWMAPEVLLGKPLNEKADVYSFAIILWEVVTMKEPFEQFESFNEFKRAICVENVRPSIPDSVHPSLASLMCACWDADPNKRLSFDEIITRVNSAMIDITIRDEAGNALWKRHFLGRDTVRWGELVTVLANALGLPPPASPAAALSAAAPSMECIRTLLEEIHEKGNERDEVTGENFGKLLAWFGPLNQGMPGRVSGTMQQPWFHGYLAGIESENKLSHQSPGSYLVRLSTTVLGSFTVSKMNKDGAVSHMRIDHSADRGFSILVSHPGKTEKDEITGPGPLGTFLEKLARPLNLKTAIPCGRYLHLFEKSPTRGYEMLKLV